MSSSESGKGLGGTDPKEAFLSARFLPREEQQVPLLQGGLVGCSPEISQLSFRRTFEQGNGARDPVASGGPPRRRCLSEALSEMKALL